MQVQSARDHSPDHPSARSHDERHSDIAHSQTVINAPEGSKPSSQRDGRHKIIIRKLIAASVHGSQQSERGKDEHARQENSWPLGEAIREKVASMRGIAKCQICESQMRRHKEMSFISDCSHRQSFCESCLHHYTIFRVTNFENVLCPADGCQAVLQTSTAFFKGLPLDIQKKYLRIKQFADLSGNEQLRPCPKQNCLGLLKTNQESAVCNQCKAQFCEKCLLQTHEGPCNERQVWHFQSNLRYRQCRRCKMVIERTTGCNHMRCKCGFQFCYVCGKKWSGAHYGDHDEQGNIVGRGGQEECCAHCEQCCGRCQNCDLCTGACCHECPCIATILRFPLRLLGTIFFGMLLFFLLLGHHLPALVFMAIISFLAGLFGYSVELVSKSEMPWAVLGVIFFPVTMILGVGVAMRQMFCPFAREILSQVKDAASPLVGMWGCNNIQ